MIGSEIGELYPILPKVFYRFNANPINIPMYFFSKLKTLILRFIKLKGTSNRQKKTWKIKNKFARVTHSDSKSFCKARITKTVWHCHKNRHTDQWNKIKSTEINSYVCGQLIFDKALTPFNGKRIDQWIVLRQVDIHL